MVQRRYKPWFVPRPSQLIRRADRIADSEVVPFLRSFGYHIFALVWSMRGLVVGEIDHGSAGATYEAPNFIAPLNSAEVLDRCSAKGWRVLGRSFPSAVARSRGASATVRTPTRSQLRLQIQRGGANALRRHICH